MARYTLTSTPSGYALKLDGRFAGLVFRHPEGGAWVLVADYGHPRARFDRWTDVPAEMRDAGDDDHPTLAELCAVIGVEVGAGPAQRAA